MKKILLSITVISSSLCYPSAFAADGSINFTGKILSSACQVTNTPSNPLQVNLGSVSATGFKNVGDVSSSKEFGIILTNCPATVNSAQITFDGNDVPNNNGTLALTSENGTATGIGIQLTDENNTVVPLHTNSKSYTLSSTAPNTLNFIARYISTSQTVSAGKANALASFSINYN